MQSVLEDLRCAHTALTEYWYSKKTGAVLPSRQDVNPCDIRRYLGHLSILELKDNDCKVRLTGSASRSSFGLRQKARIRSDLKLVEGNWWIGSARSVIDSNRPRQGVRSVGRGCHVWLRLPLSDESAAGSIVLCHDYLVETGMHPERISKVMAMSGQPLSIAA